MKWLLLPFVPFAFAAVYLWEVGEKCWKKFSRE